ncbi:DUF1853 family protein [Crocinitomix catalasitica]|uniref:DUF1853 family protein n=1 Tax=Crocinitomix catalasitica TaxID=184607 RepID=UPI000687AA46|nr:DUF1853 family protein [Crocinitomix catalasitica]
MENKSRIASVLKAHNLDSSITGIRTFNLSSLKLPSLLSFELPTNLRLGHLVEKVVGELIKSSTNFRILYENIQLIEDKKTIGEIDFIIKDLASNQVIHLELAYKFYLFDPIISSDVINNWIGPNRNDSLIEKLTKLKRKQFPLLYDPNARSRFDQIEIDEVQQSLCLLVSLFVPFEFKGRFSPVYEKAIKGYYLDFETFKRLDNSNKTYHIPSKKKWGISPDENENWTNFDGVETWLITCMEELQAPLCWQKDNDVYSEFIIVWW